MATEIKSTSIKSQNIIAEPQVNKPGSPEAGQIIQSTGTGDIAKGIYHYSGASWFSLDNAQGDLETLRLVLSTDTTAVGFSSALNSTSTLAGNTNAIPHETSTGTGMLGALEIPSTGGDALLTEFDANKVFRYYSAGANNNNDYFGIPIDIPAQTRGQNIVIKFKYRTEEASDTTSNGDFQVSIWDKSNGVKTTSTNTSAVTAGSAITVASSTGMAVGDKIWLESGGNAVNNVANSITQGYITEVTSGTSIKISSDWTPASTAGSLVVTGWLSDQVSGLLSEADSDTNKVGKDFSIAVKTEETTDQIVLWISNKSTTTNVIELFFDGILVSQNKFLQASSQTKSGDYNIAQLSSAAEDIDGAMRFNLSTAVISSSGDWDNLIEVVNTGTGTTDYTEFKARVDCRVVASVTLVCGSTSQAAAIVKGAEGAQPLVMGTGPSGNSHKNASAAGVLLKKGESIHFETRTSNEGLDPGTGAQYSGTTAIYAQILATPETSDVILLESQDEIFTDTVEYTPTWTGLGTVSENKATWSRIGDKMYIMGNVKSGTTSGTTISFTLPSGYNIDGSKLGIESNTSVTGQNVGHAGQQNGAGRSFLVLANTVTATDKLYFGGASTGSTIGIPSNSMGNTENLTFRAMIPIQGWNANFNPLLSMPLVDFGSFENVYSALIDNNGTATITTESRPFIKTVTRSATGVVAIVFNDDFFTQPPVVTVTPSGYDVGSSDYSASCYSVSSTGVTVKCEAVSDAGDTDRDFSIVVQRQGSDYKQPPQPTAAVIKPAVAVLSQQAAWNTNGGTATVYSSAGWQDRVLNTIEGESWFVTLSGTGTTGVDGTNTDFTLEPGTYEIFAQVPVYRVLRATARLYDVTNSSSVKTSSSGYDDSSYGTSVQLPIKAIITVTASTKYKLQSAVGGTYATYGLGLSQGIDASIGNSVYSTIQIRKLK